MAGPDERVSTAEIKCLAKEAAKNFLALADSTQSAKDAADWSLAAKNSIQIALTCEQIAATRNAR